MYRQCMSRRHLLPLALWGGLGLACAEPPASNPAQPNLEAARAPLVIRHVLAGTLVAEQGVDLGAPDVGVFPLELRWLAPQGSVVRKGDRVIELDNSSLVQQLEELERQVDQAETGLDIAVSTAVAGLAEAQFGLLQKQTVLTKARIEGSIPEGLRSDLEYAKLKLDESKAELDVADARRKELAARETGRAEIEIARVGLERSHRELAGVRSKIKRLEILAPSAGVVVHGRNWFEDRAFESGDTVNPGHTIARLPNIDTLYVRAELFDVDDGAIEPGLDAVVELDALPGGEIRGRVRGIDAIAQQTSRRSLRRAFGVAVDIDYAGEARLLPGMSARVVVEKRIEVGSDGREPILVPRSTLDFSTPSTPVVRLANGGARQVKLGACSSTHCIVEEGLSAGEALSAWRQEVEP